MTEENKKSGAGESSPENKGSDVEAGSSLTKSEPASVSATDQQSIEEVLRRVLAEHNLSRPQQDRLVQTFREVFTHVERDTGTHLDPEVFKIAAETVARDNENKFKYLTQKQQDTAEKNKREHDFDVLRYQDRYKILRPVTFIVVAVLTVCLFIGIYLCTVDQEMLGSNLITGVITGLLSFLAGLGVSEILKKKGRDKE